VDERKLKLQLDIVRVTYRAEARRLPPDALRALRLRAHAILDRLEADGHVDPRLLDEIAAVRTELAHDEP
jgi:hypothetical protein